MLKFLPPLALRQEHLQMLLASQMAKPGFERWTADELAQMIWDRQMLVFELERQGGGILAIQKQERRLVIVGLNAPNLGSSFRRMVKLLKKLAADMECDAVETMVWDRRLARAMQNVGVQTEAVQMVLRV